MPDAELFKCLGAMRPCAVKSHTHETNNATVKAGR